MPTPRTPEQRIAAAWIALYGLANIGLIPERVYVNDTGEVLVEVPDKRLTDWVKALNLPAPTWRPFVGPASEATWPEGTFTGRPFVLCCTDYGHTKADA